MALHVRRTPATAAQAERALAGLEAEPGLYFGIDAGIAGMHPLQAILLTRPALRVHVHEDGLEVEPLGEFGRQLLEHAPIAAWRDRARRGYGTPPLASARALLACFDRSADILLAGALSFEAHRLQRADPRPADGAFVREDAGRSLGVLYFPQQFLRRDAAGQWQCVDYALAGEGSPSTTAPAPMPAPRDSPAPQAGAEPVDDWPCGCYADMVGRALPLMAERGLVSLTLSQSYRRRVTLAASEAFQRLRSANPAPASFFLNDGSGALLLGASPDLQLVVKGRQVEAMPVCGTVARRPGAQGEADSLRELFNEEVDAAALAVCSDALRADLAPLCVPGSLCLLDRRRPMSLSTVVHAVDRLGGRLADGADAWDAIAATAAPPMLTGMPRAAALDVISQLEASPRGWYGGMMVQVASNGDALVGTILRAAHVRDGVAEVRTGGDLLAESSPAREEEESRLKARSLWRAFALEAQVGDARSPACAAPTAALPRHVRLQADGDPFGEALRDWLGGIGITHDGSSGITVVSSPSGAPAAGTQRVVAIGDAAYGVLSASGVAVEACAPEHGRAVACSTTAAGPLPPGVRFTAGRYATFRLAEEPAGEWRVWARDANGQAVVLARDARQLVCVLFRPDSLLCDETARALASQALALASA